MAVRPGIDRRTAMVHLAGMAAVASPALGADVSTRDASRTGVGLVIYDCSIRRKWMAAQRPGFDLFEPLTFLQHCRELGAGGMQAALGTMDAARIRDLRRYAEQHELFIDAIVSPPKDDADAGRFDLEIRTAAEAGVRAVRTVIMPGRRYEQFQSLTEFQAAALRGKQMLERAAPIVEKHRVRLAVENHKDQRIDERLALYRHLDSEFIGACVDTGNSFALLDDPYEAVAALAPYAFTVHLKDQAVRDYEDGFLLGDIPLGQGCFDLKRMVASLKQARPAVRFALELITRDPLKVTCLTEQYWVTMGNVPGSDLARTMRFVRQHPARMLQYVGPLPLSEQLAVEDANIRASLSYARDSLQL